MQVNGACFTLMMSPNIVEQSRHALSILVASRQACLYLDHR